MSYSEDIFQKNVIKELMGIRKSCEILAKAAITQEKAERVKLGLSPLSKEFPGYSVPEQKDDDIIAVDFDGTLCTNAWPEVGDPIEPVIEYVKYRQSKGARLILWTNRVGKPLEDAVAWCAEHGIILSAVNDNLPEIVESFGSNCRKIFANEYLDDRALLPGHVVGEMIDRVRDKRKQLESFADESDRTPVHLHGGVFDIPPMTKGLDDG